MKCALELAAMAVASTLAAATSACLHGQSSLDAPLPSYYAGHSASMPMAERAGPQVSAVSQVKPLQRSKPRIQAELATNVGLAPPASEKVIRIGGIVAEGARKKGGSARVLEIEEVEIEEVERDKSDAERRATLMRESTSKVPTAMPPSAAVNSDVYDGLPIEGRFERRLSALAPVARQAEREAAMLATKGVLEKETRVGGEEAGVDGISENKDADEDENCDDDDDESDKIVEHFETVQRVLNTAPIQSMLGWIEETYKLKAQLKIQAIEFEARQQLEAAKREQRAAQSRIQELERVNEDCRREQHAAEIRAEAQAKEAMVQREKSQVALARSAHEAKEMRLANQELQQQVEKLEADCEQTQRETLRKLDAAQRSKAELEHRARVLETQLEELRGRQERTGQEGKK